MVQTLHLARIQCGRHVTERSGAENSASRGEVRVVEDIEELSFDAEALTFDPTSET